MVADRTERSAAFVDIVWTHRLTLVVAAPGWGKSTLLRHVAEVVPSIQVVRPPSGWTPFSLARGLLDGLGRVGVRVDELPHPAPDSLDDTEQIAALAASVCVAAADVAADTVVVLDDADTAEGEPLERFLEALVLHLPPALHLVVACRRAPALRLARLRAAGQVARISAHDLALDPADIAALGLDDAASAAISEILTATAGWPLAVTLAAEALRRTGPIERTELVDRLLAPDAVLFDYLAEEVLSAHSAAERELLALTAHLPYVSDELLVSIERSELTGLAGAPADVGVFVEPVAAVPGTFRATLLGGEFLRRSQHPPDASVLHRALGVLLELGEFDDALVLCARIGDPELATRVVMAIDRPDRLPNLAVLVSALDLAERVGDGSHVAELRGDVSYLGGAWDAALAAYARATDLGDRASPRLARKRAVVLYLRGRLDEAEEACRSARLDGGEPSEVAQVLAWWAAVRWIRGDADGCQELVDRAMESATRSGDDAALATVHTTLAMLAALRGDRRLNAHEYVLALAHAEQAHDAVQIVRIRTNRGSHHSEEGSYREALIELGHAIEVAELIGSETFGALAHSNRGDTLMRMGQLDDALRDLRRAQDIWERLGSEMVDYATWQLGDVQFLRGQRSEALALYVQAIEGAERRGDVQGLVPALIGAARIVLDDDPERARQMTDRAVAAQQGVWQPHALVTAGWVALRRGDHLGATGRANDALQLAQSHHDRPAVAEALLLQAVIAGPAGAALAEESRQLWRDLGNPIGAARAAMVLAETSADRDELLASAEGLLTDAGAWGYLAELRRSMAATSTAASPIVISTLGGFRVARHGQLVEVGEWGSRKARDFLKLLVARRGAPVVRDEAAALLWPDEPDRSARRLSVLLSTIRSVLDPDKAVAADTYVAADHDTVWLVREHVDVDVELFLRETAEGRRLLSAGETAKGEAVLADAAGRYLGDFCADDPYTDWAAGTRELARHTFVETASILGRLADDRDAYGDAIRHRLRILDVDPYDETAHLDLIRAFSAQRRHGEARRAYRTYCARLAELDLDPSPFPGRRDLNTV